MGWAHGTNYKGEEVGYGVEAVCAEDGCDEKIDKGLAYCCGDLEGVEGERGCGRYFCTAHLWYSGASHKWDGQRCADCADNGGDAKKVAA
jgi:hypothetical protein